jgi:hypothetical protein
VVLAVALVILVFKMVVLRFLVKEMREAKRHQVWLALLM